ncbi:MAG TPA: hypothetical protein VM261_06530 [Kofleriaceae bacterium]|nr:hypothetical protein [Kofleriaceae bacterium]
MTPSIRFSLPALALAVAASCGDGRDIVVGDDYEVVLDPLPVATNKVDVLVVVDNSGSIAAERQAMIAAAGQSLFAQLTDDLGALPDLHVAVVSTDIEITSSVSVPGCGSSSANGRFRTGDTGVTCPVQGSYIFDSPDGSGGRTDNYDGTIADAFSCFATLGQGGCGFEQPLEAVRRALDGRYAEHAGFLRPDAMLLIAILTDEDDCSAYNGDVFGEPQAGPESPLGPRTSFRCFEFGVVCDPDQPRVHGAKTDCVPREDSAYITPVGDFTAFVSSLKTEPGLVMVAGMMGPADVVEVGGDQLQADLPALIPSCAVAGTQTGTTPPIRLAAFAESFPSRFVFENLCEATAASERLRRVTRATSGVMSRRPCLLGKVTPQTTTERCRAFDVTATARTPIARCEGSATNCFTIGADAACEYTPSGLAATYRGTLPDGHRMVVECLAAD